MKSKSEKLIESIVRKQLLEGNFGAFDQINDMREFISVYSDFIKKAVLADKKSGDFVGVSFDMSKKLVWIIQSRGMTAYDLNTQKPVATKMVYTK